MSIGLWLTAHEKAELWRRWKAGETVATIARAMGRRESTLLARVRKNGGIAPRARYRSRLALTLAEREESPAACALTDPFARSPGGLSDRLRQSAERSHATALRGGGIELRLPMSVPGIER